MLVGLLPSAKLVAVLLWCLMWCKFLCDAPLSLLWCDVMHDDIVKLCERCLKDSVWCSRHLCDVYKELRKVEVMQLLWINVMHQNARAQARTHSTKCDVVGKNYLGATALPTELFLQDGKMRNWSIYKHFFCFKIIVCTKNRWRWV